MLRSLNALIGYRIKATDGELGNVREVLFDDEHWVVRYLVVLTGDFLSRKDVLISPIALKKVSWQTQDIEVTLNRDQVESSPDIDTRRPVSRQKEVEYNKYYGWPHYWGGPNPWNTGPYGQCYPGGYPDRIAVFQQRQSNPPAHRSDEDTHLRSAKEVCGYGIDAKDGQFGHVADFIVDDETWAIRYFVIDTKNYWPAKSVLIAPAWVSAVNFPARTVSCAHDKKAIKASPEYDPYSPVNRDYEQRLYDYYGSPAYWSDDESDAPVKNSAKMVS